MATAAKKSSPRKAVTPASKTKTPSPRKAATPASKTKTPSPRKAATPASKTSSMQFVISEDNGGMFTWTLQTARAGVLAQSKDFTSRAAAQRAAQQVIDGAGAATFDTP
jgi:uncharacterized protein YegP (UPF0339 family)